MQRIRFVCFARGFSYFGCSGEIFCFCLMIAAMIFDDLRQGSPAAKRGCSRLDSLSNGGVELGNGDEGKESKVFRRKRMEIRRVRLLSVDESDIDLLFRENNLKKQRSEVVPPIEDSLSVRLPEIGGREGLREAPRLPHGMISVIGRRREMEDVVSAELGFLRRDGKSYDFFGVYDGHGGRRVAQACGEMLHKVLANVVQEGGGSGGEITDWQKVMAAGFRKMDEEVNKIGAAVATVGSTAVVAVVGEEEVVVANCGDSRAVLCRSGVAVPLSDDHKPDRPDELERIELSGGKVIDWNGQRVLGVLATSRSIGDDYLKPYVISEPEVTITPRSETDEFLILASDGLWDVVSKELACQVVRRCFNGQTRSSPPSNRNGTRKSGEKNKDGLSAEAAAAAMLGELAMARGSRDNISVVVVGLKF